MNEIHKNLITDNNVVVSELPKTTQNLITKFASITDEDAKKAMDEKIYNQIKDFLEAKAAAKPKAKPGDVSAAATATPAATTETAEEKTAREAKEAAAKAAAEKPKERSVMSTILGRKS